MPFLLLCVTNVSGQEFPAAGIFRSGIPPVIPDTPVIRQSIDKGKNIMSRAPDSAVALLKESLIQSDRSGYAEGVIYSLKYLGEAYVSRGQTDSCLWLCRQAFSRYSLSPEFRDVLPSVYNILGNVYKTRSDYKKAAAYYFKSIALSERYGSGNADAAYNNLATVFMPLEQYKEALFYLDKAEAIAGRNGHYEALGYALLNKGLVYGLQGEWESGRKCLDSSLAVARAYGLVQMQYLALAQTGGLYLQRKMPEKALGYLSEARALTGMVNPDYQVLASLLTGEACIDLNRYEEATPFLLEALRIAGEHNLNRLPALAQLYRVYKERGLYEKSLKHFEAYKQLSDEVISKEVAQNLNQLNIRYRTAEKDRELAQNQLLISIQKNQLKSQRLWLTGISAGFIIIGLCLWMRHRIYRHKQQLAGKTQEIKYLKAILQGEEQERRRMARELHDGIVSQLMAIRLGIHSLKEREDIILPEELEEVHSQVREATEDLRRTAHNLVPDIMKEQGLAVAVASLCGKTEKNTGITVNLEVFDDIPRYDADMELSSFRMIQELVQNTLKHAKARSLLVQLSCHNGILHIAVEDDGKGIPETVTGNGSGLKNIMNRVKAMNGVMHVEKVPDGGTAIYIEHPVNPVQKDITHVY